MDLNDSSVSCAVNIIWNDAQGQSVRKVTHKIATLKLIRNDLREMFIEVSTDKTKPIKLKLSGIAVHKKFMNEGKASINFNADRCTLFMSNAPPGNLLLFLKTIFVKISGEKTVDPAEMQKKIRAHLLSGLPTKFEEISPISNIDIQRTKKLNGMSKATVTTPSPKSRKRKIEEDIRQLPAAKKLYADSALGDEAVKLNEEQNEVFQSCLKGHNVFFTGSAGTGKSFMLKRIISALPPEGTVATASTGVAACLIGGVTLHAFAGIGDGEASLKRCYELASRPVISQGWRKCKRLIIDEISMVDGEYFDKIEAVARYVRRNDKPFGGIQLILCGDFLQLPPVTKTDFKSRPLSSMPGKRFCFQSDSWKNSIGLSYELKIVHRQKDAEFVKMLNLLRIGHVNDDITNRLLATSRQQIEANGILATQLCSHTNDANSINESCLQKLEGESKIFQAEDSDLSSMKQLDSQVPAPGRLELKIGAQVMLLKNVNVGAGLVNGARGIIVSFHSGGAPVVRFRNKREYIAKSEKWVIKTPLGGVLTRKQVPLKLAWAFSIHKSQGLTLDCVEMSLSKVFEAGQAYVALSRAQSLQCIRVMDFDPKQVWANPDVLQFYKMFRRNLHDTTFLRLGGKDVKKEQRKAAVTKIAKSLMSKPLINIC